MGRSTDRREPSWNIDSSVCLAIKRIIDTKAKAKAYNTCRAPQPNGNMPNTTMYSTEITGRHTKRKSKVLSKSQGHEAALISGLKNHTVF